VKHLVFVLMAILLAECTGSNQPGPGEYIYWVNGLKVPCTAAGPTQCLQIQKGENPDPTEWLSFYAPIAGFDFEAGYVYKLIVKETELDPSEVPADASSIEYTLVEILEKKKDERLVVNDIWVLETLNNKSVQWISSEGQPSPPQLEIKVGEMKYKGTDGCNNYMGGIIELNESAIRFGLAAGTRMMCQEMEIADLFNSTLPEVRSWETKNNQLHLFGEQGNELMQLKKID